jgi:hypothetical protein
MGVLLIFLLIFNFIRAVDAINAVTRRVEDEPHFVAHFGLAIEDTQWHWLGIHRSTAS